MIVAPDTTVEVMAVHIDITEVVDHTVSLPTGWEPLSVAEKQGNDVVLLIMRPAQGSGPLT